MATKKTTKAAPKKKAVAKTVKKTKTQIESNKLNPYYNPVLMLQDFLRHEAAGGAILIFCAILAMIVANSPLAHTYHTVLHETTAVIGVGAFELKKHIIHWINDGLMAIFFIMLLFFFICSLYWNIFNIHHVTKKLIKLYLR